MSAHASKVGGIGTGAMLRWQTSVAHFSNARCRQRILGGPGLAGWAALAFSTRAVMLSSVTLCRLSSWEKAEET